MPQLQISMEEYIFLAAMIQKETFLMICGFWKSFGMDTGITQILFQWCGSIPFQVGTSLWRVKVIRLRLCFESLYSLEATQQKAIVQMISMSLTLIGRIGAQFQMQAKLAPHVAKPTQQRAMASMLLSLEAAMLPMVRGIHSATTMSGALTRLACDGRRCRQSPFLGFPVRVTLLISFEGRCLSLGAVN
jgi:hypothetical protein